MGKFVWRLFIVIVIFISGLLVGNIFAPKQILQEKDFVGIIKVQTSLDLEKEDNFIVLSQSQNLEEVYFAFLRQYYQKTKLNYEQQLINITKNPQDQKDFIKAQKDYLAVVSYIEQNYPIVKEENISLEPSVAEEQPQEQPIPGQEQQAQTTEQKPEQSQEAAPEQTNSLTQKQTEQTQIETEIALTPQATQTETI